MTHFSRVTFAAAAGALAAAPALAGTMEKPAPQPEIQTPAPAMTSTDWTGPYVGGQIGFGDVDTSAPGVSGDGALGGITFGYDHDFGNWVFGGGVDYDVTDITIAPGTDVDNIWRAKLRGGYKVGSGLIYGTGGFANIDVDTVGDDDGYFIGGGYEHMITDRFSLGGEVLYHEVDNFAGTPTDVEATTVQMRGLLRF
ncbi:outer membrane protein [Roseovarius salinarum]|uniref:outer membrane protein n=1 Tax=Roseovarius salinarum TaxID=1981892 RepID=UPI000C32585D|nr:outer membrane beta-barrel protein [Roseovarius salinarum]